MKLQTVSEDAGGTEESQLEVTGAGLLSSRGSQMGDDLDIRSGKGPNSRLSSGTMTPATFRRNSKVISTATQFKNQRKSLGHNNRSASASSTQSSVIKKSIIKEASNLPNDTVEDALLPRTTQDELLNTAGSRALAIRLVDHPAATNCTKYIVLRPNAAPTPSPSVSESSLLPKRQKATKKIKKIAEIEYALKWDLKDAIQEEDEEEIAQVEVKKTKTKDPVTPRSVSSVDSGINLSRDSYKSSIDKAELSLKLKNLQSDNESSIGKYSKSKAEPESGYGTPQSFDSRGSLPTVSSAASNISQPKSDKSLSKSSNGKKAYKTATPASRRSSERISIDSKPLKDALHKDKRKTEPLTPMRFKEQVTVNEYPIQTRTPSPPPKTKSVRDPIDIMETMDSVFHTVPIRDTGIGAYSGVYTERKQHAMVGTQTDDCSDKSDVTSSQQSDPKVNKYFT